MKLDFRPTSHLKHNMQTTPCFTLSATPFTGRRVELNSTCSRSCPRRIYPRRVRATAAETDAEVPQQLDAPQDAPQDGFEREVPGKIVLDELTLAKQRTVLEEYARELRKKRLEQEREDSRLFGFVPYAETLNGRLSMFFFVTGLLTEYWTGYTIPEQIELMLRTLGVI